MRVVSPWSGTVYCEYVTLSKYEDSQPQRLGKLPIWPYLVSKFEDSQESTGITAVPLVNFKGPRDTLKSQAKQATFAHLMIICEESF